MKTTQTSTEPVPSTKVEVQAEPKVEKKTKASSKAKKPQKKERKSMAAIMNPMLLSGKHTLDEVVNAVVKAFKVKEADIPKLRRQIAGPRLSNLREWAEKNGKKAPALKQVEKKKEDKKK